MESDTFFRSYAIIGIVLFICLILVVKAFIWIAKKFFGFLRARFAVNLLKRGLAVSVRATNSVVFECGRVDEKPTSSWPDVNNERRCSCGRNSNRQSKEQNNQVLQRGKYGTKTNVIQPESLSQKERVERNRPFDICPPKKDVRWNNQCGTIYRQESKNKRGEIPLVTPFQHRKEAMFKKNKRERGAPFRGRNEKVGKCRMDKCVRGCAIPVEELVTRNNNDNCRGRDDGTFHLDETSSFTDVESACVKRKEVDGDLDIGHPTPSDGSKSDRFNKPGKVAQRTSNFTIKHPVRLWSVDSDTNVNTENLAPGDHQNSCGETIKQIENTAVSSRKEDVDSEALEDKFRAKVKQFSRIVDVLAKVMLRVVMDVAWPLWQCVKEEWELFNEIYGGDNSDATNNSDNDIKASNKGQDMEYYNSFAHQCFQCAKTQVAAEESESVETSQDLSENVPKQKLSAKLKDLWNKTRALYSSVLAAVKSRAVAVASNIRLVFSRVTSRSSFHASTQEGGETTVDVLDLAATAKTELSQPRSEQPLAVETQSAPSCAMKSSGQNNPSQKLCSKKDKKVRFRESPIVYYTNDPVSQKRQTKKRHASSLPSREVPPARKGKREQRPPSPVVQKSQVESERKAAEKFTKHLILSPHTLLYTNAPSQVKELQCVGVFKVVMSPNVDKTHKASTPQRTENTKSTKMSSGKESNRSHGKRRYKEEESAVIHQNEHKAEVTVQEAVLTELPEKRHPNQSVSKTIDKGPEETTKVSMKRKNEAFLDQIVKPTHELARADDIPRLPQSSDKSKPKLADTMEIEDYIEVPFATQLESIVVNDVSNGSFDEMTAANNGQQSSASPNTGEQVQAMDATESDPKELLQNTQQTQQSSWNFFPVPWPPFLGTLFSSQATMEEMEVVQEQLLFQKGDEEMVLDENPELLKISCAPTEEMDVDPQNLAMMGQFVQPQAMDTDCVQAPPVPWVQLMTPMKSLQGFGASRPVASPFTELMDTKRPLAPTTRMLQDAEMQVQVACDEKLMIQDGREHGIQPVVEPLTQPPVKRVMPKLLPAKVMDKQNMQPIAEPPAKVMEQQKVQLVTSAMMQPSQQEAMSGNVKPVMPKTIVRLEQVSQSNVSPVDQRVTDSKEQFIMEKLQLVPGSTDPYLADVSDSDEDDDSDDDSDDEVELDLQTIEKFSQLEASPEHAQHIMNLLAEKEHREATKFRDVVHSDSDDSDEEEELDPDTKCKLYKLEACVQMYKDYNQKLAELVAAEESTTEQCNM